mmetsp:Transcript_56135/g.99964  ORF Transcript_56135/g.99964 Transcript_56135/m.99964 type:complete len:307 (-) Transcript_56135:110-1030(-)|eukprot:CAMPEP_0197635816 /NCGR_PEP_ID=MMETSP1338-20131121/11520_1 /TAXON_ID=43686 ORGANISM="Pelagodinium beii, Strain RCC1491" /NCGR_SAMPLE_ID=MMETSP1338 /ASSEMBLY_ACC=CAM_ASM_000754 /LENGTH=306 /DNA_ID=CAMNT_0043207941 /DNA_START=46 /DNA_END=966 /DNA_ORIENTATION=-
MEIEILSLSGDHVASLTAELNWTVDDALEQLSLEEHRICSLTSESPLFPSLPLAECGLRELPELNHLTAIFWSKAGLEAEGLSLRVLLEKDVSSKEIRNYWNLRSAGYSLHECRCSGYGISEVRQFLQSPRSRGLFFEDVGSLLKDAGFSPLEMHFQGYNLTQLRRLGFSCRSLFPEIAKGLEELRVAGFTLEEIFECGFSIDELLSMGLTLTAGDLRRMGWSVLKMQAAGFSASKLKQAGFALLQLKDVYSLPELKDAGYNAWALMSAGFKYDEMRSHFSEQDLIDAGYTVRARHASSRQPRPAL